MEEIESIPANAEIKPARSERNWIGSESAVRVADLFVGLVAITLVFWLLQRQTQAICCGDFDGYFHIILIPFTWFRDLQTGAKVAAVVFASLAVFSCYWLVVRYEIRYRLIWLLALLASSAPFLYRLNMTKAPPFAIIFTVAGIYLLFKKKYWPLVPLAFVFTLTYDMFVLLILTTAIWTVVLGWTEERFEWRPIVWVLLGAAAGQ